MEINGRMKVKTLKSQFNKEFGLTLRVYDGRSFADDDATLASIRKGDSKSGEFSPRKNTKVGNLEDKIQEMFGIKVQISGSDDSYLCNNDLTLQGALEDDGNKLERKVKKSKKIDIADGEENDADDSQIVSKEQFVEEIKGLAESMINDFYQNGNPYDYLDETNIEFWVTVEGKNITKSYFESGHEMPNGSTGLDTFMSEDFSEEELQEQCDDLISAILRWLELNNFLPTYNNYTKYNVELGICDRISDGEPSEYSNFESIDFEN